MKQDDVLKTAFAMPLTSPAFPPGPYRFINREFFTITYHTDPNLLRDVVPEPLVPNPEGLVKFEFIRMPNSTGFGDYTESGQVIPVSFNGVEGGYSHAMYLDDEAPIAGGREIWGFPKKLGAPRLSVEKDTLLGTLDIGPVRIATATMGFKYTAMDLAQAKAAVEAPAFLLKIIPHVDCTPRICELVRYASQDVTVKGAWSAPARLELFEHALAPVADLPVHEVVSASHILTDLTLGLGTVVHDYLA
ncbi:acetoacetate decarboxylase [Thioclava sp. 15-R06ZXC-3]|uniref:Acetoacetate decarboxylase n=1 Tax=Thioclava arctica TaxID=3238301 RepID=A0ABV3TP45_9RHOB